MRIGLAHGGIVTFGSEDDRAETIPPDRAVSAGLDYLALGDWHGVMRIGERTFYSGSPERDRFKHQGRGVCLAVTIQGPGVIPQVTEVEIGQFDWSEIPLPLTPEQNAADAFAAALSQDGISRRDTLLRVCASGWSVFPNAWSWHRQLQTRHRNLRISSLATPSWRPNTRLTISMKLPKAAHSAKPPRPCMGKRGMPQ